MLIGIGDVVQGQDAVAAIIAAAGPNPTVASREESIASGGGMDIVETIDSSPAAQQYVQKGLSAILIGGLIVGLFALKGIAS